MDRRLTAIIVAFMVEVIFRAVYPYAHLNATAYTLIARITELSIILGIASNKCGIAVKNIRQEIYLGIYLSVIFGLSVFALDFLSRHFLGFGLLCHVLGSQYVVNPILFFIAACCIGPLVEELFFRGLLYAWMRQRLSILVSVLLSAAIFASMHGNISIQSLVQLTGGIIFALVYEWRRNIWPGYIIHCLANLGLWILPLIHLAV